MKLVIIRNRIQTFDSRLGVRTYELLQLSSRPGFLYSMWLYATVAVADGC